MAPLKAQLDKAAWQWADSVDPENVSQENIETAYRVSLKTCPKGECRRNCKGNPNCLNGLGEGGWFCEIDDRYWHDIEDPNEERRGEDEYVGLKNLGATCYVNTFLQVWFHNPEFRTGIYQWREPGDQDSGRPIAVGSELLSTESPQKTLEERSTPAGGDAQTEQPGNNFTNDEESTQTSTKPVVYGPQMAPHMQVSSLKQDDSQMPSSICGHLQLLFALLQFSKRGYVDPSPFINCLGLDAGLQQDAQEFCKLFISLLEDALSTQTNPAVKNLVQEQFSGQYAYVTSCSQCGIGSQRPSKFYELDLNIQGHKELNECIEEFLKEEKLEGDNKYMCAQCNSKQDATRAIHLRHLPPVLNLQLLRFVFDRNTGHKKKLNTFIQFPEVLDMSKYVNKPEDEVLYDLTAVLIHRGPSAYSGHYIAHIKERQSDTWYKFNDEEIQKMKGKNLQLGNEEEIEGSKGGAKKPRASKGYHCSRNAYMLVYRRRQEQPTDPPKLDGSELPTRIRQLVETDNERFEEWIQDMIVMRETNIANGKIKQEEVKELYEKLKVQPGDLFEWVPTKWLIRWLEDEKNVPCINNEPSLCPHKRLDPDKVPMMKCISRTSAELLHEKFNISPRLKSSDSLCRACVVERCRKLRMKARLQEDQKIMTAALKSNKEEEDSFWVGRRSLRSWKRLVLEQLEETPHRNGTSGEHHPESAATDSSVSTCDSSTLEGNRSSRDSGRSSLDNTLSLDASKAADASMADDMDDEENSLKFNQDLLCEEHGNLAMEATGRKLVSRNLWERFKLYFPDAPEFHRTADVCSLCKNKTAEDQQVKELNRALAADQKGVLGDLYLDKHRPTWKKGVPQLNIIPTDFLEEWRKFIKEPIRREPITDVINRALLCPHAGFPFQPELIGQTDSTKLLTYIWPMEWENITKHLSTDIEIRVNRVEDDEGNITFLVCPDMCQECCQARQIEENRAKLDYTNATVYIRKVLPENKALSFIANSPASQTSLSGADNSDKDDPEFVQVNGKRKKVQQEAGEKISKVDDSQVRRSSRHRRLRGEKELTVSSSDTLRDLKLQIMRLFSVAPFDQHLMLEGRDLVNDKANLATLGILPGSVLYLKADEPCEDPTLLDDITRASYPEEGFKGTGLLGR